VGDVSIVQLRQERPVDNVAESLRRLADEIESEHGDYPVTTCVVLLGHTDSEYPAGDGAYASWDTRGTREPIASPSAG
jgi:hypothetical protein